MSTRDAFVARITVMEVTNQPGPLRTHHLLAFSPYRQFSDDMIYNCLQELLVQGTNAIDINVQQKHGCMYVCYNKCNPKRVGRNLGVQRIVGIRNEKGEKECKEYKGKKTKKFLGANIDGRDDKVVVLLKRDLE